MRKSATFAVLVLFALLTCLAAPALAEGPPKITILSRGIFSAEVKSRVQEQGTLSNERAVMNKWVLRESTTRIPARIGTRFGLEYEVIGGAPEYKIVRRTIYPREMRDPGTGKSARQVEYTLTRTPGRHYADFGFDEEYDLVPGTWTFQFLYEGKVIAEQRFEVYKP